MWRVSRKTGEVDTWNGKGNRMDYKFIFPTIRLLVNVFIIFPTQLSVYIRMACSERQLFTVYRLFTLINNSKSK